MRKRVLGVEHPETLTSMADLASTFRDQSQRKEAEKLEIQVVEMRKRVLVAFFSVYSTTRAPLLIGLAEVYGGTRAYKIDYGKLDIGGP